MSRSEEELIKDLVNLRHVLAEERARTDFGAEREDQMPRARASGATLEVHSQCVAERPDLAHGWRQQGAVEDRVRVGHGLASGRGGPGADDVVVRARELLEERGALVGMDSWVGEDGRLVGRFLKAKVALEVISSCFTAATRSKEISDAE